MLATMEQQTVTGFETELAMRPAASAGEVIMSILRRGELRAEDIQQLRREVFADGLVSKDDAEGLFAIERSLGGENIEWTEFFVEAITDYTVWQLRPTGIVSQEQGEWLMDQVDRTKSMTALAALFNILAEADRIPSWLPAAARGRAAAGWAGVDAVLAAARAETQIAA